MAAPGDSSKCRRILRAIFWRIKAILKLPARVTKMITASMSGYAQSGTKISQASALGGAAPSVSASATLNRSSCRNLNGQVRTGNGENWISSESQSWPRFLARLRRVMATRWGVSFLA